MWERITLKNQAKEVLKKSYFKSLLVSFVTLFIMGNGSIFTMIYLYSFVFLALWFLNTLIRSTLFTIVIICIVAIGFLLFIGFFMLSNSIRLGLRKYFVQAAQDDIQFQYVANFFKFKVLLKTIVIMAFITLITLFGLILFIIPGVIFFYQYRLALWLLAENPSLSIMRVLSLSKEMVNGHKYNMFLLDLSFSGWWILAFATVVGPMLLIPYIYATFAELYLVLRKEAIANNLCTYEEVNLSQPTKWPDAYL